VYFQSRQPELTDYKTLLAALCGAQCNIYFINQRLPTKRKASRYRCVKLSSIFSRQLWSISHFAATKT